jgi:hypothetical protein
MMLAARGHQLTLPARPDDIVDVDVCALSGERAGEHCPHRKREHFIRGQEPKEPCHWHDGDGVHYPPEVQAWAERKQHEGGRGL